LPDQLDEWEAKHANRAIQAPFTNTNVAKWRDEPTVAEAVVDFDPKLL
jgi:hypothetical protein